MTPLGWLGRKTSTQTNCAYGLPTPLKWTVTVHELFMKSSWLIHIQISRKVHENAWSLNEANSWNYHKMWVHELSKKYLQAFFMDCYWQLFFICHWCIHELFMDKLFISSSLPVHEHEQFINLSLYKHIVSFGLNTHSWYELFMLLN